MENNEIEKTLNLLDKDYFHVYKKIDENGKIESWGVYYKNMNDEDYLSIKNRPLLSSEYSTVSDIMSIKEQFDKSKEKAEKNIIWEKFKLFENTYDFTKNVTDEFFKISLILEIVFLVYLILLGHFTKSIFIYPLMLISFMIILVCFDYLQEKIRNGAYDVLHRDEKILLKNELKHRKGNIYEFRKKSRKNNIEEI